MNNPGLAHLAENIFGNLADDNAEICGHINLSAKQILDNPMFWLRKFKSISKANQKDWINVIKSVKNFEKIKAIISYFQWNLKKEGWVDLPCYTSPDVQDNSRTEINDICRKINSSDDDIEMHTFWNSSFTSLKKNPDVPIAHDPSLSIFVYLPVCSNEWLW